jgi:hypothetical protein
MFGRKKDYMSWNDYTRRINRIEGLAWVQRVRSTWSK